MQTRFLVLGVGALFCGGLAGSLLAPQPTGAVSRDMIELQQQVTQLLQGQQDLRSDVDSNSGAIKVLVQQSLDSVAKMNGQIEAVQKTVQEVQANTGARIDSMTQQTQGISDNVQDVQARVAKLAGQLNDIQSTLQSIDAKVSGGSVAPPPSAAPAAPPANSPAPEGAASGAPPEAAPGSAPAAADAGAAGAAGSSLSTASSDTLYRNALRDYTGGKYDLSQQEFSDYIQNFPSNDLASNSQFYIGEIAYAQNDFKGAIKAYNVVLDSYPMSFKVAASLMKRGMAELELGLRTSGVRDLREVVRRYPGSDEAKRAQAKLRELGAPATPRAPDH